MTYSSDAVKPLQHWMYCQVPDRKTFGGDNLAAGLRIKAVETMDW